MGAVKLIYEFGTSPFSGMLHPPSPACRDLIAASHKASGKYQIPRSSRGKAGWRGAVGKRELQDPCVPDRGLRCQINFSEWYYKDNPTQILAFDRMTISVL